MARYYGCHVSASGGLVRALERGEELGVNTIQLHPSAPQRWNRAPYPEGVERELLSRRPSSSVQKLFFHSIYLINLATPHVANRELSITSLVHDLELGARIGVDGVIFHVGSMKDEPDEEAGIRRAADCVNEILLRAPRGAPLLLEVAAGSGSVIGDRFEELHAIFQQVREQDRVGFALDTQHLWASGYKLDIEFDELLESIERLVGLEKIGAIHLNDSKSACGSRIDRHENLGDGMIGRACLESIFLHPKLAAIPFILETPALRELEGARGQVEILRELVERGRAA